MSKLGKALIRAIRDAKKKGLVPLETTSNTALLHKKLKFSQQQLNGARHFIKPCKKSDH